MFNGKIQAVAKFSDCPMSARKMRLVIDHVRGKDANKALAMLKFTRKEGARWLEKILKTAIANWREKTGLEPDDYEIFVSEAFSDAGPMLKRLQPAPMGRGYRVRKRTNHVTLVVENRAFVEQTVLETAQAQKKREREEMARSRAAGTDNVQQEDENNEE